MLSTENTVRVEARFKNARLFSAIEAHTVATTDDPQKLSTWRLGKVSAFCRLHDLNYGEVCDLLNLRRGPLDPKGCIRRVCERIANVVGATVEYLFPAELYAITWPDRLVAEVSHDRFLALRAHPTLLLPPAQDDAIEARELRDALTNALGTITPREEMVLRMRFGLDDGAEMTFSAIAKTFGRTTERIRQIEARALRKLRHASRVKKLEPFRHE